MCVFLVIRLGFYLCLDTGCSNRNSDLIQSLKNVSLSYLLHVMRMGYLKCFSTPSLILWCLLLSSTYTKIEYGKYKTSFWVFSVVIPEICEVYFLGFLLLEVHHSKKWFVALCGGSNISSFLSDWLFLWLGGSWHPLQNVRGLQCVNGLENLKFSIVYMLTRFMSPF